MTTTSDKVQHVLRAPDNDRGHTCHWPGCRTHCKPAFFSCRRHWFTWPKHIRDAIWAAYRPGQEQSKDPSAAYMRAVDEAERWAIAYERSRARPGDPDQGLLL
jgi:hypothetical protein